MTAGLGSALTEVAHDVVAIGCGPFNLGLTALASRVDGLDLATYELQPELRWHPGMMFDDAVIQLSCLADLVTLIDPTHPLSFLAYLRAVDRLYAFFIREEFHPTRREYQDYLRWVASQLPAIRFSHRAEQVEWDARRERFRVTFSRPSDRPLQVLAKHLVLGIGTEPSLPAALAGLPSTACLHSADYLHRSHELQQLRHVTVVGSGQSAAEIVLDLLRRNLEGGPGLSWYTRTGAFAPLDYTKLVLEMTTPMYIRYFHGLRPEVRSRLISEQWQHYKGISRESLERIYELLYRRELDKTGIAPVDLRCGVVVEAASMQRTGEIALECKHRDTQRSFEHRTELVIAATGYREREPACLGPLESFLRRDSQGRYRVRLDYSLELAECISGKIFVANADLHSHGVAAPDLGIGAYRNAMILNAITGRTVYPLPERTAFTTFVAPSSARYAATLGAPAASDVARAE